MRHQRRVRSDGMDLYPWRIARAMQVKRRWPHRRWQTAGWSETLVQLYVRRKREKHTLLPGNVCDVDVPCRQT